MESEARAWSYRQAFCFLDRMAKLAVMGKGMEEQRARGRCCQSRPVRMEGGLMFSLVPDAHICCGCSSPAGRFLCDSSLFILTSECDYQAAQLPAPFH